MTFRCCFDRCIILLEDSSRQIQELCFPCYCMTCIICNLSTKRSHFKWQWELFWELDAFCFRCSGDLIHLPFLGAFLERDFMLLKKLFAEIWGRFRVLWFAWQQSVWEASLSNVALNTDISPKTHILRLLCLHPRFVSQPSSAFLGPWSLFWELLLWKSQQAKQKVSRYCSPLSATAPFCKQTHRPAVAVDSPVPSKQGNFFTSKPLTQPRGKWRAGAKLNTHTLQWGDGHPSTGDLACHFSSSIWERDCAFDTFLWPLLFFY